MNHQKKLIGFSISTLTLALIISPLSYAGDYNGCKNLNIRISNSTDKLCTLVNANVIHGKYYLNTTAPADIAPGASSKFVMTNQDAVTRGPEVQLEYQCGENSYFRIRSQQNYCMFAAGDINATVLTQMNLNVTSKTYKGAYWFTGSMPGSVEWTINK